MNPTGRSDAEVRSLARSLWRGLEQGTDALARLIRARELDFTGQVNPDFVLSQMVAMNLLSVADHARSMCALTLAPKLGPSSATVARGALEPLARVRWIVLGESENEVLARALVALHSDVSESAHVTEFIGAEGDLDRREYLAIVSEHLNRLDVQPRPQWGLRKAAKEASAEAWGDSGLDDWTPYSQLSSTAHGMMPALGALLQDGLLRLPRQEIVNHIAFVYGIADRTVHALARCPVPLLGLEAVVTVWEPITIKLEPLRRQLMEEDNGERPMKLRTSSD